MSTVLSARPASQIAEPHTFQLERQGGAPSAAALLSGEAHRRTSTELASHLFSQELQLRALLDAGFTPIPDTPELSYFDRSGSFELARCELRLNRLGKGPIRVYTSFYREGRLVGCASQRGALECDPFGAALLFVQVLLATGVLVTAVAAAS